MKQIIPVSKKDIFKKEINDRLRYILRDIFERADYINLKTEMIGGKKSGN